MSDIHIKEKNRGKFTALMKRTGHSASWFKAHGTPSQKKMATFALNARKWKHADGGIIERYGAEAVKEAIEKLKQNKYDEAGQLWRIWQTGYDIPVQERPSVQVPYRYADGYPEKEAVVATNNGTFIREIPYEIVPAYSQRDMTAYPQSLQVNAEIPVKEDIEGDVAVKARLGENKSKLVQSAVSKLQNGDELKEFQKELLRKGYYRNVKTPEIKAKTKEEIAALQQMLIDAGYDLGSYGADGKIGRYTRNAWSQYVKEHPDDALIESVADGKLGPETRAAATRYYQDVAKSAEVQRPVRHDKILPVNAGPSLVGKLASAVNDGLNLRGWKKAVSDARGAGSVDENGIPVVDFGWKVTDDALSRAATVLPKGLHPYSQIDWAASDKSNGIVGYPNTWDSPEYIEQNRSWLSDKLQGKGGIPGLVSQALRQPGRGSIGGFSYRTTPLGIEISDGYQFAADPKRVVISDKQTDAYNDVRSQMNTMHRGKNTNSQYYLIPWDEYYRLTEPIGD